VLPLLGNDELVSAGVLSHILKLLPYNTAPLNLSGHPAVAVPSGENASGLPTSLQIATRRFEEEVAVRVAQAVEEAVASTPLDRREGSEHATS
jgi:Asp-tRNA(Asn)/Glu-tRNA(Gln) amidotransferase A subunit family amidase